MEEIDIFSNLNIYGWIFTISLCAFIAGWLGSRLLVIIAGGKIILDKPDKTKALFGYWGYSHGFYKKSRKQAATTLAWLFFRLLFWTGLAVLIIFWASIYFLAPPDFTLNNLN